MHPLPQTLTYLPLETTMPLLNPIYPPQYYQPFTQLKKLIELQLWTQQANSLAQHLIPFGQTNYNLWYVKKMCFLSKVVTLQHQLQFSQTILFQKIKNFQLWEHRRFLLQNNTQLLEQQYSLIGRVLQQQPKNYHAWSHRTWILNQLQNYTSQIQLTNHLLTKDSYNNSVWAYRTYLLRKILEDEPDHTKKENIVQLELSQCLKWLAKHLDNLAAWNYLRGYFPSIKLKNIPCTNSQTPLPPTSPTSIQAVLTFVKTNIEKLQTVFKDQNFLPKNYHYECEIQLLTTLANLYSQNQNTLKFAKNTCTVLAEKDPQKRYYWKWVASNL